MEDEDVVMDPIWVAITGIAYQLIDGDELPEDIEKDIESLVAEIRTGKI